MKAAVWNGPCDLTIRDLPELTPSAGEVLIQTKAVGICGSDLEIYHGRFEESEPPLILGHEEGGVIEATGAGVSKRKRGDKVIVEFLLYCGECEYCTEKQYGLCDHGGVLGMIGAQGEYAEYFVTPEKNCYLLPEEISWRDAGLIDTLAGPIHGFNKIQVGADGTVAVFGPGPAGLFFCQLAKLRGASRVYLIGTRDNRLEMGRKYGADLLLNVRGDNAEDVIKEETGGRGVDIVVEAAGSDKALNEGLKVLKKAVVVLVYGVFGGGPVPVDVMPIKLFEFTVLGSCGLDYSSAIELIRSGAVPVRDLVSHTFTLEELVEVFSSGFIQERRNNYMKGVVLFE